MNASPRRRFDWASALVRSIVLPLWTVRDHPHYYRYLREFQRTQHLDRAALEELQMRRLRDLLQHAYSNCDFYRRRLDAAGLDPAAVRYVDQIAPLPVLTKRDIQDHGTDMLARNIPLRERVRNQTGGSTGSPLQFYVDKERFDSRMASTTRHNQWAGLRPGDWYAYLWGARLDQVANPGFLDRCRNQVLYRRLDLNTSKIQREDWERFTAAIRKQRPRSMIAYAQSAVLFARYLRENGIDDVRFEAIITTAEVLLPENRQLLEAVFGGQVFNRYGCRELSVIASECECHQGMHVNAEALLVEVVPHPTLPASSGRIVITDLLNKSMPLIRYEIGDVGVWAAGTTCACGRGLPLLADVQGRTTDFLVLSDGRQISGPSLTLVVADMADVRQVQFVQHNQRDITLRVVPGRNYGASTQAELRKRMQLYLGDLVHLELEEVASIASELSGKYRFVVSELGNASRTEVATAGGQDAPH